MAGTDTRTTIETIWRIEAPKLIAGLTRIVRDIGRAEDLAHDALVAALEQWPSEGIPRNPGAWLMQTGKHRAIDHVRRAQRIREKDAALIHETPMAAHPDFDARMDADAHDVGDDSAEIDLHSLSSRAVAGRAGRVDVAPAGRADH